MSMMQKLLEINDEAVALLAECEQLRSDQKTLQEICAIRGQRIVELEADLRKAFGERDELRSEHKKLQDICADGGRRITELQAERDEYVLKVSLLEGHIKSLQADRDAVSKQCDAWETDFEGVQEHAERLQAELDATRKQLQALCTTTLPPKSAGSGLLRDVSHYTEAAEVDTPVADDAPTEPVKVREGRWRTRAGQVRNIVACPQDSEKYIAECPWWDGKKTTWADDGRWTDRPSSMDLVKYLGPIEPEVKSVQVQEVTLSAYVVGDTVSPKALRIVWATEEWIEQSNFGIVHAMKDVMFLDQDRFTPEQFSLTLMLSK